MSNPTTTKTIQKNLKLRYEPIAFRNIDLATSFAYRADRPMRVVLGDDCIAWVVCPADASRLERAGYEMA